MKASKDMHRVEQRTRAYKAAHDVLADRLTGLHAAIDAVKREHLRAIKAALATMADRREALQTEIKDHPELFEKPRSAVFHGVRVGFKKGSGKVEFKNPKRVVKLIRKLLPDQFDTLVKVEEKPLKAALSTLPADTLKKLGCTVGNTGDQVLIKVADTDIDKMIEALMKDWDESDSQENPS